MNSLPHPAEDEEGNDVEFPPFVEPVRLSFDRRSGDRSLDFESSSHERGSDPQSAERRRFEFARSPVMEQIGPWRLVREIGHGGMGIVYEAVNEESGVLAALKFLLSAGGMDQRRLDRFRQEARVIERLSHPNIVQLRSVEQIDGHHFLVMQLIDGISLDRVVGSISTHNTATTGNTTATEAKSSRHPHAQVNLQTTWWDEKLFYSGSNRFRYVATLVQQAAQSLSYAHAQRVIHRDIKPSNLLVDRNDFLWITDFGLAQIQGEHGLTATGDLLGTLRYMSPEQAMASRVPVDHHTDVYSLGVTMYELLCGKPAFDAEDRKELLRQVLFDDPTSLSSNDEPIPVALQIICEKAMQKDARHRYSTAGEMADDLFRFLSDSPIRARRPRTWELGLRWCKRNTALAASITMLTVLLIVLTVGRFIYNEMSERHERTVNLLKRTVAAESESRAFANLRSVARYRQTGLAGLGDRMNLLKMNAAPLSDGARNELRNEWLSCMARADWRFTKSISCSASVAAVSHSRDLVAELTDESSSGGSQRIRIRSLPGKGAAITSEPLGFDVKNISFSSGDKYLVITDFLDQWQILRCDDGRQVFNLPQLARGCDVNESADQVAFWYDSSTITLAALDHKRSAAPLSVLDSPNPPDLVRFSPDGTMLAVLGIPASPRLTIIDAHDGHVLHDQSAGGAITFAWSPDGKLMAVPVQPDSITIYEAATPRVVSVLSGPDSVVATIAWHPSGNYLMSAAWSGEILLRHVFSGRILVRSHDRLDVASFSTDGRQIGWQRDSNSLRLTEWSPGDVFELPWNSRRNSDIPSGIAIHPQGRIAAIYSLAGCQLFDLQTSSLLYRFQIDRTLAVEFSESGDALIVLGRSGIVRIPVHREPRDNADDAAADELRLGPLRKIPISALLSGVIASGAQTAVVRTAKSPDHLTVLSLSDGTILHTGGESLPGMDVNRAGNYMVRRGWRDTRLEVCNAGSGERITLLNVGLGSVPSGSADSRFFVTSSLQHLQFWDPQTWTARNQLPLDAPVVGAVPAFHPTESLLAVRLLPGRLGFIELSNPRVVARIDEIQEHSSHAAMFSPDGKFYIELSGSPASARAWNLGNMRRTLARQGLDWSPANSADPPELSFSAATPDSVPIPFIVSLDAATPVVHLPAVGINEARSLYQANPESPHLQNMLAWRLLIAPPELRSDVEALELARRSNISNPNYAAYRNTLGLACFRNQLFDEADALLQHNLKTSSPADLTLDLIVLSMIARNQNKRSTSESFRIWAEQNFAANPPATDDAMADIHVLFAEDRDIAQHAAADPK